MPDGGKQDRKRKLADKAAGRRSGDCGKQRQSRASGSRGRPDSRDICCGNASCELRATQSRAVIPRIGPSAGRGSIVDELERSRLKLEKRRFSVGGSHCFPCNTLVAPAIPGSVASCCMVCGCSSSPVSNISQYWEESVGVAVLGVVFHAASFSSSPLQYGTPPGRGRPGQCPQS